MGVLEFLCDRRFHQSFVLQPKPGSSRPNPFRISYADYGDSTSDAVVLLCGALVANRFCYSPLDLLAKTHGVRIIHPDRPGVGGTDMVEQNERISLWLEMVPQLLVHLGIDRISIASHSGGAIYAMNTMLTFPHLLHPSTPYVTFFAPWVHPVHSGVTTMRVAELLPAPVIGRFASVVRFVNEKVVPMTGLSGAFVHNIKDAFRSPISAPAPVPLKPNSISRNRSRSPADGPTGLNLDDPAVVEEMRRLIVTYIIAEAMDGISADAQLFLRKPQSTAWCSPSISWSDMDSAVPIFLKIIEDNSDEKDVRKWVVDTFHAEEDNMVGTKGRLWFDTCWNTALSPTTEQSNSDFQYRSEIVPKTDHSKCSGILPTANLGLELYISPKGQSTPLTHTDYLMDPAFGASAKWLQRVREAFPKPEEEEEYSISESGCSTPHPDTRWSTYFTHIFLRTLRRPHFPRPLRTRAPSPHEVYSMLDALRSVDSSSSTRACRKGKVGAAVRGEKYWFQHDTGIDSAENAPADR